MTDPKSSIRNLLGERPGPSAYLDDAAYARLMEIARGWTEPGPPAPLTVQRDATALLNAECRLIDDDRLEAWLDLFIEHCIYWIPGTPTLADPRTEITWELHDRRRLEDRVARLRTGNAFAQIPRTRTRHCLTNVEIWEAGRDELRVRSNLTINTFRDGVSATVPCMAGYVLQRRSASTWLIEIKQVNLIDGEYAQGNLSFFL